MIAKLVLSHAVLFICYALYRLLLSKQPWFQLNRWILNILPLLAIAAPFVEIPASGSAFQTIVSETLPEITIGGALQSGATTNWVAWAAYAYFTIALLLCIAIPIRLLPLVRMHGAEERDGYKIYESEASSFSFFRNIYINASLAGKERSMVFRHEQVHADHFHSADVLWYELMSAIFWCNPVIWLLKRDLRDTHEFIADRQVRLEYDRNDYLNTLLNSTFRTHSVEFLPMFNHSQTLLKRVKMINKKNLPIQRFRYYVALPLFAIVVIAAACTNQSQDIDPKNGGLSEPATGQTEQPLKVAEQMPEFPGGKKAMVEYLINNLKYPEAAEAAGVTGRVLIQFVVEEDGTIADVNVVQGIGSGCDEEAARVVAAMPNWSPGVQDGQKVSVQYTLPIQFAL